MKNEYEWASPDKFAQGRENEQKQRIKDLEGRLKDCRSWWYETILRQRENQVAALHNKFTRMERDCKNRIMRLKNEHRNLRLRLKVGEITKDGYQSLLEENKNERERLRQEIYTFQREGWKPLFPVDELPPWLPQHTLEEEMSMSYIRDYLSSKRCLGPDGIDIRTFTDNAFFLLSRSAEVLADPQAAGAVVKVPLPTPHLGSEPPIYMTLGAYLDMWLTKPASTMMSWSRKIGLIYWVDGNPMTGRHSCSVIRWDGKVEHGIQVPSFLPVLKAFGSSVNKYSLEDSYIEPYSLEEVVEMLRELEEDERRDAFMSLFDESQTDAIKSATDEDDLPF